MPPAGSSSRNAIALSSDEDEPIQLVKQKRTAGTAAAPQPAAAAAPGASTCSAQHAAQHAAADSQPGAPAAVGALTPAERIALNAAREARARERKRALGLDDDDDGAKDARPASRPRVEQPRRTFGTFADAFGRASPDGDDNDAAGQASSSATAHTSGRGERFWDGAVKRSYNDLVHPKGGTRLSELLLPTTSRDAAGLQHVLFSSFTPDPSWLASMLPAPVSGGPQVSLVVDVNKSGKLQRGQRADCPSWWQVISPGSARQNGWGCQHVKFIMLFYPDRLRICILTGNLIEYDWKQNENLAYVQDFRLLPDDGDCLDSDAYGQFDLLFRSWRLTKREDRAYRELERYDLASFGGPCGARLLLCMPAPGQAAVTGWTAIETRGLGRLKRIVKDLGITPRRGGMQISAQGSSLGPKTDFKWLHNLHLIASGMHRIIPLPKTTGKAAKVRTPLHKETLLSAPDRLPGDDAPRFTAGDLPPIKILFPTAQQVERSAGGIGSGGCHFASEEKCAPYKALMHKAESQRGNILMHHKLILALQPGVHFESAGRAGASAFASGSGRTLGQAPAKADDAAGESHTESEADDEATAKKRRVEAKNRELEARRRAEPVGFLYLGSANFTVAAWGHISLGANNAPTMSQLLNHELGVVIPISRADLGAEKPSLARDALAFVHPAQPYAATDEVWDMRVLAPQ